jgi:hypothetical protein
MVAGNEFMVSSCHRIHPTANLKCVSEVTRILEAAQQGDPTAGDQLLPLVCDELRRLAAHKMANEAAVQTLQPTALVHEVWLRLVGNENQKWNGRAHFFGAAAEAMRRILIENARRKRAARHGGGQVRLDINEIVQMDGYPDPNTTIIVDYPASYHHAAGGIAFADGHSEIHKWRDPRTMPPIATKLVNGVASPNNQDVLWLQDHCTRATD